MVYLSHELESHRIDRILHLVGRDCHTLRCHVIDGTRPKPPVVLQSAMDVSFTSAFLITTIYWPILYEPGIDPLYIDINSHALNSVFVLIDLFLSRVPTRILHFYQPIVYGSVYAIFTVIYWAAGGTGLNGSRFIYKILDFDDEPGMAVLYIVLIVLVATPLFHLLTFAFYALRTLLVQNGNMTKWQ
eukprot:m.7846 g.7846  ORF g.7846 m.7846 type:complete len:187 (+) comp19802_c0_seq2:299-859(+)